MDAIRSPLILYVPGLMPKPEPETHKAALERCLLEGVRRADADVAEEIRSSEHSFDIVSWTFDFYREYRDFAVDADAIDRVIEQQAATTEDVESVSSWARRATVWLYRLGDLVPFLIPHLASEQVELHIRDLLRYTHNANGIADHIHEMLKVRLRAACRAGRPILLIGHSMGSVIAWDSLWEMTHRDPGDVEIDLFLSMGSPLGQNFLQKRIRGHDRRGSDRYPKNFRRWINLSAVGDMTAIDPVLADDFAEMVELGLVDKIDDRATYNFFRLDGRLNVHAEYGYLVNRDSGAVVADWWRRQARKDGRRPSD